MLTKEKFSFGTTAMQTSRLPLDIAQPKQQINTFTYSPSLCAWALQQHKQCSQVPFYLYGPSIYNHICACQTVTAILQMTIAKLRKRRFLFQTSPRIKSYLMPGLSFEGGKFKEQQTTFLTRLVLPNLAWMFNPKNYKVACFKSLDKGPVRQLLRVAS